jgi:hypothetical protein
MVNKAKKLSGISDDEEHRCKQRGIFVPDEIFVRVGFTTTKFRRYYTLTAASSGVLNPTGNSEMF